MFGLFKGLDKIDKYFGDYDKPEVLIRLEMFQEKKLANWDELEFWISYDNHYSITPLDVIPFARTGSNGIHFGFLTDFNRINNLKKAPIVCIAPTYDPPVNIVADNLEEFLSMVLTVQNSVLLADIYKDDDELKERINEWFEDDEYKDRRENPNKALIDKFTAKPIANPIKRIVQIKENRKLFVETSTNDGLGIKFGSSETIQEFDYSKSPTEVEKFLSQVNLNSRIKFYRNSTFFYILNKEYDNKIKKLIIKHLNRDGFKREAKILKENY